MRASFLVLLALALLAGAADAGSAPPPAPIELRADEVTLSGNGTVVDARGTVRLTYGASRMTADRAVYAVRSRQLALSGRVTISTPQGSLTAASATAVLARGGGIETITADGGVRVTVPPDLAGRGGRLVMKPGELLTLQGHARIQSPEGSVDADRIELDERTAVAFARGNVAGVYGSTRITSAAATFYSRERRAVFRGDVRATAPGRTIRAEMVTIYLEDRRIVAEGETTIRLDDQPERP